MGKRHAHEEHENHERWVISFADMMTLLFALFVVLYAQKNDELRETVKAIAFHLNFEGLSQSRKEGEFDTGNDGGQTRKGTLIFSVDKGPMTRFLEVQAEEYEASGGRSLEIRQLDEGWEVSLPLAEVFDSPKRYRERLAAWEDLRSRLPPSQLPPRPTHLRGERREWLVETVERLAQFEQVVRLQAAVFEGPVEEGRTLSREGWCWSRLVQLMQYLDDARNLRDGKIQIEFRHYKTDLPFLGDEVAGRKTEPWQWTGRLTMRFVRRD